MRKLGSWNKDSLTGKAKAIHRSKAKQGIHLSVPMARQVFSHFQESRAPSSGMVIWEDKCHLFECPLLPSSSPTCMLNMMAHGKNYPLCQVGSSVSAMCLPENVITMKFCFSSWAILQYWETKLVSNYMVLIKLCT